MARRRVHPQGRMLGHRRLRLPRHRARRRSRGVTSTETSAPAALWSLGPRPQGTGRPTYAASVPQVPRARSTSVSDAYGEPLLVSAGGTRTHRAVAPSGAQRAAARSTGPSTRDADAVARMPGRETPAAGCAVLSRSAARGSPAGRGRRRSAPTTTASACGSRAALGADRDRLRADHDLDARP